MGDLELILERQLPRNEWLLGRVVEARRGTDDLVRSASGWLRNTELVRPITITKLCVLKEATRPDAE